ncbi:hypothetical protein HGRIS_011965 [Hohenbuehelia grisea]|uniref:Uncharacterized protein n=1 Tax=Hohenbuehelia grisea TaxID=104357 RepID=A0ABR3JZ04_9AGAR
MALQSRKQQPHLPADTSTILVTMAEATDDSLIFATTPEALRQSTWMGERFQSVYGWETNWDKSLLFIRNVTAIPRLFNIPSVNQNDPQDATPFPRSVAVSSGHLEFLCTEVNDHAAQLTRIIHAITTFEFPSLTMRLPFTALRRSHPVTHLEDQALTRSSAHQTRRCHPRRPPDCTARFTHIYASCSPLNPISDPPHRCLWIRFPSQRDTRDLNHHITTLRLMAEITLADWTCDINASTAVNTSLTVKHSHELCSNRQSFPGMDHGSPDFSLRNLPTPANNPLLAHAPASSNAISACLAMLRLGTSQPSMDPPSRQVPQLARLKLLSLPSRRVPSDSLR